MASYYRRLYGFVLGLALGFLTPQAAYAVGQSATDGNGLLSSCEAFIRMNANYQSGATVSASDSLNGAFCSGYVMGVVDDHISNVLNDKSSVETGHFCLADGVTPHQTIQVVVRWLDAHPERLHERAIGLVLIALSDGFPCRKSQ